MMPWPSSRLARAVAEAASRRYPCPPPLLPWLAWTWRAYEMGHTCLPTSSMEVLFGEEWRGEHLEAHDQLILDGAKPSWLQALATDSFDPNALLHWRDGVFALPAIAGLERSLANRLNALAREKRLQLILGGPGSGKTTAVAGLLANRISAAHSIDAQPPRIALAAPTGRAAARLSESMGRNQLSVSTTLQANAASQSESTQATTVHRLLGVSPTGIARHHAAWPLDADVVVVDEASMLDLQRFAQLLEAIGPNTELILLGDPDQLEAVEAGSVLAQLRAFAASSAAPEWNASLTLLQQSHRFDAAQGIGQASMAVLQGDVAAWRTIIHKASAAPQVIHHALTMEARELLLNQAVQAFSPLLDLDDPIEMLRKANSHRVLCALREGPWGVAGLNREIASRLGVADQASNLRHAQLIVLTENDVAAGLFNGDLGVIWQSGRRLQAVFVDPATGAARVVAKEQLPAHQLAYAMTVHRAQGSEFEHIAVVLPPRDLPLLHRQWLYTALTRARNSVRIFADAVVLETCIERHGERCSQLARLLGDGATPNDAADDART